MLLIWLKQLTAAKILKKIKLKYLTIINILLLLDQIRQQKKIMFKFLEKKNDIAEFIKTPMLMEIKKSNN